MMAFSAGVWFTELKHDGSNTSTAGGNQSVADWSYWGQEAIADTSCTTCGYTLTQAKRDCHSACSTYVTGNPIIDNVESCKQGCDKFYMAYLSCTGKVIK